MSCPEAPGSLNGRPDPSIRSGASGWKTIHKEIPRNHLRPDLRVVLRVAGELQPLGQSVQEERQGGEQPGLSCGRLRSPENRSETRRNDLMVSTVAT